MLPPWPAGAPAVCAGMEERACACWQPRHYGSSAQTGNQTEDKKQMIKKNNNNISFDKTHEEHQAQTPQIGLSFQICAAKIIKKTVLYKNKILSRIGFYEHPRI